MDSASALIPPVRRISSDSTMRDIDTAFSSVLRSQPMMVIDAVAISESPQARTSRASARLPQQIVGDLQARRGFGGVALTAAILLGFGGGAAGMNFLFDRMTETQALADANDRLRARVSALESAHARATANDALASVQTRLENLKAAAVEKSAELAARLDKLDQVVGTRYQTLDKPNVSRDITATIHTLPVPPLSQVIGGTNTAKAVEKIRMQRGG